MRQTLKFLLNWIVVTLLLEIVIIYWLYQYKNATFGTNDDALISSIYNGYFGDQYQNYLIFVQPIIAIFLRIFQNIFGNANLYSHFLLFTSIISYSSIFAHLILNKNKWAKSLTIVLFSLFSLTFITWFSINPTYTGASLFAVGASGIHFLISIKENNRSYKIFVTIIGSLFLSLGFLIRKESLFVFAILFIPLFIYLFIKNHDYKNFKLYLPSLGILILIFTINTLVNGKIYESEDWKQYEILNNSRHQIQLRAPEKVLENKLTLVNWDYETYQLFLRMALVDQQKMNQDNMNKILQVTNDVVGPSSILQIKDFSFISQIKVSFQPWTWILKLLSFSIFLIVLSLLFDRKRLFEYLIQLSMYLVPIFTLLIVLSSGYQLPERITLNLLAASFPVILFLYVNNTQNYSKIKFPWVLLLALIIIIGSWDYFNRFKIETQARTNFYASRISYADQQKVFISKMPDSFVFLGSSSVFKSDWQFPYSKYEPFDPDKKIAFLGWHNLSPMWINFMSELGIDGNNFPDSYFDPTLVYVESADNFEFLKKYLNNLDYRYEVTDLGQFGPSDYNMYKLKLI